MKIAGFCVSLSLCMAATHGGISDALGASGPPLPPTPVSPSSAASPPALDMPAAGAVPYAPAAAPRNPGLTPMPAPAPTSHYAGLAENPSGQGQPGFVNRARAFHAAGVIRSNA